MLLKNEQPKHEILAWRMKSSATSTNSWCVCVSNSFDTSDEFGGIAARRLCESHDVNASDRVANTPNDSVNIRTLAMVEWKQNEK